MKLFKTNINNKNTNVFNKIGSILLTISIVLAPILLVYKVVLTITFFDVLSALSIIFIFIGLLADKNIKYLFRGTFLKLLPLFVVVIISLPFTFLVYKSGFSVFLRTIRLLYYLAIIILYIKFFNRQFGFKFFKWVCIVSTIFIFIQFIVLKVVGKYISGFVPFFPMVDESLKTFADNMNVDNVRPRSFFQEPAHYGAYVVIYLFIDFFYNDKRNIHSTIIDFFLIIGIIFSGTNTGIILAGLTIFAYYIKLMTGKQKKKELIFYSVSICIGIIALVILYFTGALKTTINQMFSHASFAGRFQNYSNIFDFSSFKSGFLTLVFGRGMVETNVYYAGFARILYYFGLFGLAAFSYSLITNKKGLPFVIFYMILNLGTETALGPTNVLFFALYLQVIENGKLLYKPVANDTRHHYAFNMQNSKIKILFLCNGLISGGAERLLSQIIPFIQNKGHKCYLLILSKDNERYYESITSSGVHIDILPKKCHSHLSKIRFIRKYILKNNFDIVHANLFPTFYYVAIAKMLSFCHKFPPICLTEHSTSNKRRKKSYFRLIEKMIYRQYNLKICISEDVKTFLLDWLKLTNDNKTFTVILNGVDIDCINQTKAMNKSDLNLSNDTILLGMVGSFTPDKNHAFMIDVLSNLSKEYKLLLIGEGALKDTISQQIDALDVKDRVIFTGFKSNPYSYIKCCDIIVIPSKREGFCLVAPEAMSCHKPIIYSDIDGLDEIVGDAGIKCPLNVNDFVNAIVNVSKEPFQYIHNGDKYINNYDINLTAKRYLDVFSELCRLDEIR